MGLLASRWVAEHAGHTLTVHRNELTRGFTLAWDGTIVAKRAWSWVGLGDLEASVTLDGRAVPVRVALGLAGAKRCQLWIDGVEVPCRQLE